MLGRIARAALLPTAAAVLVAPFAAPFAWADGIGSPVECSGAACTITVGVPGQPPGAPQGGSSAGSSGAGWSAGSGGTQPSPSGSFRDTPCTYRPDPTYQPPAGADPHPAGSGGWYLMTCPDALKPTGAVNTTTTVVWLATPPPAAALAPSPAQLAAQARSMLRLTVPVIGSSPGPGRPDLVGVNVWAWVDASAWSARSATASAAGESVTATAKPTSTTWDFGDGTVITCQGPGAVYQPSDGPNPVSPTCGHAYLRSGSFTITVTVRWAVTWAGAGQSGAFNDMTTTASAPITVEQSQAVVTR